MSKKSLVPVVLPADPAVAMEAATKQYVDGKVLAVPVTVPNGGTGRITSTTPYALIASGTGATTAHQTLPAAQPGEMLVGNGPTSLPTWTSSTGTGAPVRATSPTLTTPTVSGQLTLGLDPVNPLEAAPKQYVDSQVAAAASAGGPKFTFTQDSPPVPTAVGQTWFDNGYGSGRSWVALETASKSLVWAQFAGELGPEGPDALAVALAGRAGMVEYPYDYGSEYISQVPSSF